MPMENPPITFRAFLSSAGPIFGSENSLFFFLPHCSNHQKIVFWPLSGVKWGKIDMCHKINKFSNGLMNHFPRYWVKIPKFDNYHPPPYNCRKIIGLNLQELWEM